jgi:hypothetical protein
LVLSTALLQEAQRAGSRSKRIDLIKEAKKQSQKVIAADDAVLEGPAYRLQAFASHLEGNTKAARSSIERAVTSLSISGEAFELAAALLGRAALLGSSHDEARAAEILTRGDFLHPNEREGLVW